MEQCGAMWSGVEPAPVQLGKFTAVTNFVTWWLYFIHSTAIGNEASLLAPMYNANISPFSTLHTLGPKPERITHLSLGCVSAWMFVNSSVDVNISFFSFGYR